MLIVLGTFMIWTVAFYLAGLKEWSIFTLLVLTALGIGEYISIKLTGVTLSERFYRKSKTKPLVAHVLALLMILGLIAIIYHLYTLI
ncbi:hypothetical protein TMA_144 [Thermus phage TMA]|uniref:hypothetical protein n=1 Tax=Thermus phage TMA TaxID=699370 RepID=UPI0000E68A08|nr:hypothetical protein TMA_144 [Thermus phage TMA]YP_874159.1 hypothetical protein YS40_146 [Thermus phage phiYS40]ABJ91540.1 hypothetical protein YS40_146 [Thermus phage phiYS40]BAK53664.1 hypothetical protein YSP_146 [Thermus phage phiYS40]BAK53832.1 hypothetical protein TMA_144 [Thermus phage TMA]